MNTHNFVVERLREILAKLESTPSPTTIPPSYSVDTSKDSVSKIFGGGISSSPVLSHFSPATFPGENSWPVKDDEVVEAEVEGHVNIVVSSNGTSINPATPQGDTSDFVYGIPSLFPREIDTRTQETSLFGTEMTGEPSSSSNPRLNPHRKGIFFPVAGDEHSDTNSLMKHLQELIQVLKMSSSSKSTSPLLGGSSGLTGTSLAGGGEGKEMELNLTLDDIADLNSLMSDNAESSMPLKHIFIIISYLLIAFISIIGNLLVVQLVIRSRRLHTLTHALLANLAVADLLMATLNIPFSAARVILAEWPFGSFLCHVVPFAQVTSVYVTSITMAVIAVDRYQVIINPLGRRMKNSQGVLLVLGIWSLSALLSLPFALHHKVVTVLTFRVVNRCQAEFSSMERRRWLTVATVLAQYFIPLTFTTVSYICIMTRLGLRSTAMGSTTPRQVAAQSKAKRKTIKMLMLTVIFFAACWAPINAYHLLTHFSFVSHNSTAILTCHLIAMSSTCYNPFIYCWLNEHFRREALKWLRCFRNPPSSLIHPPGMDLHNPLTRSEGMTRPAPTTHSSTLIQLLSYRRSNHINNTPMSPPTPHSQSSSLNVNPPPFNIRGNEVRLSGKKSKTGSISVPNPREQDSFLGVNRRRTVKYANGEENSSSVQSPSSEDPHDSSTASCLFPPPQTTNNGSCSLCQSSGSGSECPGDSYEPGWVTQCQSQV